MSTAARFLVMLVLALSTASMAPLAQPAARSAPAYVVEPFWPKDMPEGWMFGNVVGIAVDSKDNVWVTHRPRSQPGAENTPPVVAFDSSGKLIASWGGLKTIPEWGTQEHGLYIDGKDNVWVGFGGGLPYDVTTKATTDNAHFLKLTPQGKLVLSIGRFGRGTEGSLSTQYLGNPTDVHVDPKSNEAFITDGYLNRRVIVVDADTGAFKRLFGAYGNKPDDTQPLNMQFRRSATGPQPQQFNTPHCIVGSNDGLLYVCDRGNQRIQVFKLDGTFVKDVFVKRPDDQGAGLAPQDIALSADPRQQFVFVQTSDRVYALRRDTMEFVSTFGRAGRSAGQVVAGHSLASDSKGNLFVGETLLGSRLQKFVPAGQATR